MLIPGTNLYFIHIPRTGGSSLEIHFGIGRHTLNETGLTVKSFKDKHLPARVVKRRFGDEYELFAVVREPIERAISHYRFFKIHHNHPAAIKDDISFDEWIGNGIYISSVRPQSYWVLGSDGEIIVDHLFDYDGYPANVISFLQLRGVEIKDLSWINKTDGEIKVSAETESILRMHYEGDYQIWAKAKGSD